MMNIGDLPSISDTLTLCEQSGLYQWPSFFLVNLLRENNELTNLESQKWDLKINHKEKQHVKSEVQ